MANHEQDTFGQFLKTLGTKGGAKISARTSGFGPWKKTNVEVGYEKSQFERLLERLNVMFQGALGMFVVALIAGFASGKLTGEDIKSVADYIGNLSGDEDQTQPGYNPNVTYQPQVYVRAQEVPTAEPTPDCMDQFAVEQVLDGMEPGTDITVEFNDGQVVEGSYLHTDSGASVDLGNGPQLMMKSQICKIE